MPAAPYDWTRARQKWCSDDPFYTEGAIVCDESPPGGAIGLRRKAELNGWVRGKRRDGVETALPPIDPGPVQSRLVDVRLHSGMVTLTTLLLRGVPVGAPKPVQRVRVVTTCAPEHGDPFSAE